MPDPFTTCHHLIRNQLLGYAPLQADGDINASEIQAFDENEDPRQLTDGMQVMPVRSRSRLLASSTHVAFVRAWRILYRKQGLDVENILRIEWAIHGAMCLFVGRKGPDGEDLAIPNDIAPLLLVSVDIVDSDAELEPLLDDAEDWQGVCDIEMTLKAKRSEVPQLG